MLAKDGALSFDVNAQTKRPINAAIQFSTQDINTARLSFKLTKDGVPLPLSAVVGKLVLSMADGSRFIRAITLVNKPEGLAEYILAADEIQHYGTVKAELVLYYTNGQALSIHKFGFNIEQSLIDQDIVPVAEYYIDDFETLRGQINDLYDDVVATVAEIEAKFEDLDNVETKAGAQAKVDAHANNTNVHVTSQKKAEWDAKETPNGAQEKANASLVAAKKYTDDHAKDTILHTSSAEKTKWNSGQLFKITNEDGFGKFHIGATDDFHDILPQNKGFSHFTSDTSALNGPGVSLRGLWASNSSGLSGSVLGFDNVGRTWRKTVSNGVWSNWERVVTDAAVTWQTPSLSNGWKQYVSPDGLPHTLRYSKDAMGVVEIIGSIYGGTLGNDVVAFTLLPGYRPLQSTNLIGVASSVGTTGVPQYHRTFIGVDGRVCIQSSSNSSNPTEFITFGFRFKSA
ncbi:phage baseplate upper protein [Bacillus safensis]